MSDTISVRDHTKPCEHGSLFHHWITLKTARWWKEPECLGGKEMTLRQLPEGKWMEVEKGS